jgi:hypothetical protein
MCLPCGPSELRPFPSSMIVCCVTFQCSSLKRYQQFAEVDKEKVHQIQWKAARYRKHEIVVKSTENRVIQGCHLLAT